MALDKKQKCSKNTTLLPFIELSILTYQSSESTGSITMNDKLMMTIPCRCFMEPAGTCQKDTANVVIG